MNAPDTIYLQDHQVFMGYGVYRTEPWDDDIVYDRRKTCVWKMSDGLAWNPHRLDGRTLAVCMYPEDHDINPWCPYCGGRIELEE